MLHNNISFNCKGSEDVLTKITTNCRFWLPYSPQSQPPWTSAWALYHLKVESLGYIYAADSMPLSSFKFLWW